MDIYISYHIIGGWKAPDVRHLTPHPHNNRNGDAVSRDLPLLPDTSSVHNNFWQVSCMAYSPMFIRVRSVCTSFKYIIPIHILPESMILHIFTFNFKQISNYTNRFTLKSSIRLKFSQPCARVLNTSWLDFKWVSKSFVNYIHRWLLKSSWLISGEGREGVYSISQKQNSVRYLNGGSNCMQRCIEHSAF